MVCGLSLRNKLRTIGNGRINENLCFRAGLRGTRDYFQRSEPGEYKKVNGERDLRSLRKCDPSDHRSSMDVHGYQPGPRLAGGLRVPKSHGLFLQRTWIR